MNPWKIIGWIVLGFMVLLMYSCYQVMRPRTQAEIVSQQRAAEAARPVYEFTVQSFTCESRGSYTTPRITGRNTGNTTIPYAKIFVTVGEAAEDTYFSPTDIPPGSIASADPMVRAHGRCSISGMQDGYGNPVTLR